MALDGSVPPVWFFSFPPMAVRVENRKSSLQKAVTAFQLHFFPLFGRFFCRHFSFIFTLKGRGAGGSETSGA
jgi:hypothetical protein